MSEKMEKEVRVRIPDELFERIQLVKGKLSVSEFVRLAIETQCDGRLDKLVFMVNELWVSSCEDNKYFDLDAAIRK